MLFVPSFCTNLLFLGNSSTACVSFSLSIKKRANVMLVCCYVSMLCYFGYYPKIMELLFGNLRVTQNVISNLVLVIIQVFSANSEHTKMANCSHAKNSVTLQLLKSNFIWHRNVVESLKTYVKLYVIIPSCFLRN